MTINLLSLLPSACTNSPISIAVSGGADSMALALLAQEAGLSFTSLNVDHGLRAGSAAEAMQVAEWMAAHQISHHTLRWEHGGVEGNVQEKARDARYHLLNAWCHANNVRSLLTAHHLNDQAETLLLRLKRGSHVRGLSGILPESEVSGIRLIRPLLSIPKSALVGYLESRKQPWIEDPSNANEAYDRTHARALLASLPATITAQLAHTAEVLGQLRELEDGDIAAFLQNECSFSNAGCSMQHAAFFRLGESLALGVLSQLLVRIGEQTHPPRFTQLEMLYSAIREDPSLKRTLNHCEIILKKDRIFITATA